MAVAVGRERALPELIGFDPENLPAGCFMIGDAARRSLGQTAMAVGDGLEAAMKLASFLEDEK